jgi:hypothetical protein
LALARKSLLGSLKTGETSNLPDQASNSSLIMETPQEFIEGIARSKGSFTELFRQEADKEAREGRIGMLQAVQGAEEIRKDLSKSLDMYLIKSLTQLDLLALQY